MTEANAPSPANDARLDRALFILLALVLLAATVIVAWQMMRPGNRAAVERSLSQDALGIISASQTWAAAYTATDSLAAPFQHLRFDRIGYFDGLSVDGRSLSNEHGIYTLIVAPDGASFTLEAIGPDGIRLEWRAVEKTGVPNPIRP